MSGDGSDEKEMPSRGFAKLDVGIVDSTLWMKPHDALRVWICLLAKCDSYGIVRAAAPAVAHLCFVTLERFEEIIEDFCSPDEHSRSKDGEGRRLQKIDGGWMIVNYLRYRDMMQRKAASHADRQARYREKLKARDARVTASVTGDTEGEEEAEGEVEAEAEKDRSEKATSIVGPRGGPTKRDHQKAELDWRIDQTWKAHLEQRRLFYSHFDGRVPPEPTLTAEIRKSIVAGLKVHDSAYLARELRDDWTKFSKVRAAGMGIFHDQWCSGRDKDSTKRFLEPWRPWKSQRGKGDPIERFAQVFFALT